MTKSEETIHAHAGVAENTNAVAVNDFFSETCAGESGVSILPSILASLGVAVLVQCAVKMAVGSRPSS